MNSEERTFDDLTGRVLGAVFEVSNALGAGFLEKVYQRALVDELPLRGIRAAPEVSLSITCKGYAVGEYFADILVEDVLVIELKMCRASLQRPHRTVSQLFASLGATPSVCSSISRNLRSSASESSADFS